MRLLMSCWVYASAPDSCELLTESSDGEDGSGDSARSTRDN